MEQDIKEAKGKKNVSVIKMSSAKDKPDYPKINSNRAGWVNYGAKNLFPREIVAMTSRSPVNKAIIASTVTYICGKGIRDTAKSAKSYVGRPNPMETWDVPFKKTARDYKEFGGFYLQVILNEDETTVTVYHQDFSAVRIGEVDEMGRPSTFRISNDWTKTTGKWAPIEVQAFDGTGSLEKGKVYLFYYWDYEPDLPLYCVPDWYAAAEYVKADGALGEFYNNSIENGFTPSVVVSLPTDPDDDTKDEIQRDMEGAFSGPKGASRIVMIYGEDGAKPTITPFLASANADIYNNLEGIVFQKIISAHRLASPTLAGVSGSGNLSGNAAEIIDAYVLYNYTVIEGYRRTILDALNIFTRFNGTAELVVDELDVLPAIRASEASSSAEDPQEEQAQARASLSKKEPRGIRKLIKQLFQWK